MLRAGSGPDPAGDAATGAAGHDVVAFAAGYDADAGRLGATVQFAAAPAADAYVVASFGTRQADGGCGLPAAGLRGLATSDAVEWLRADTGDGPTSPGGAGGARALDVATATFTAKDGRARALDPRARPPRQRRRRARARGAAARRQSARRRRETARRAGARGDPARPRRDPTVRVRLSAKARAVSTLALRVSGRRGLRAAGGFDLRGGRRAGRAPRWPGQPRAEGDGDGCVAYRFDARTGRLRVGRAAGSFRGGRPRIGDHGDYRPLYVPRRALATRPPSTTPTSRATAA